MTWDEWVRVLPTRPPPSLSPHSRNSLGFLTALRVASGQMRETSQAMAEGAFLGTEGGLGEVQRSTTNIACSYH